MNEQIFAISQRISRGRSAHIAMFIPIGLDATAKASQDHIVAKIKFSVFVEQRLLDIFLEDKVA